MPPDWQKIRAAREDITDWVIHWTKPSHEQGNFSPFDILKLILRCGYLKPTFAPHGRGPRRLRNTIQGSYPAVCFTEQPLLAFIRSCHALPSRYKWYGLAVDKRNLFGFGGRPVFYGDEALLDRLHDEDKYLWVRYHPIPTFDYPVDWTHEREWRARPKKFLYYEWGESPGEGVPLILPPTCIEGEWTSHLPTVVVKTSSDVTDLREFLAGVPKYDGPNGFIRHYYKSLAEVRVIPLQPVLKKIEEGDNRWARIESIPWEDFGQLS